MSLSKGIFTLRHPIVTWVPWDVSTINPQGVWQRYQGELAGALGVNALPDNELTRRVLKVSCLWLEIYPQQKSTKKKGENRVCCRFLMCLGGSRLNLRKYDPSPTKFEELTLAEVWAFPPHRKKTLKKAPLRVKILYIFWNHMNHIYIYTIFIFIVNF